MYCSGSDNLNLRLYIRFWDFHWIIKRPWVSLMHFSHVFQLSNLLDAIWCLWMGTSIIQFINIAIEYYIIQKTIKIAQILQNNFEVSWTRSNLFLNYTFIENIDKVIIRVMNIYWLMDNYILFYELFQDSVYILQIYILTVCYEYMAYHRKKN